MNFPHLMLVSRQRRASIVLQTAPPPQVGNISLSASTSNQGKPILVTSTPLPKLMHVPAVTDSSNQHPQSLRAASCLGSMQSIL